MAAGTGPSTASHVEGRMAECKDYSDVTREQLGRLKQKLQQMGITPPEGDNGTIEAMGVKLTVAYDEGGQKLRVCIVEKPAFIPESMVWGQIEGSLKG
jgi:hypothetical protein